MEIIPTQKIINRDGIKAVKNGQKANRYSSVPNQKKPEWIRVKATFDKNFQAVKQQVQDKRLNTVCEEAMCPNISECWSAGTATFMLMGSVCTRACKFCSVDTGNPKGWLDLDEPMHTAKAVKTMVLTALAVCIGSSKSNQPFGFPVSTEQNLHALVQTEPINIKVAVPADQHSEIFGHIASSHTVFRRLSWTCCLTA